jgi:prepilin-type N-terminal cleavage/methylation domain-containing protein
MRLKTGRDAGFTLIELLVVIAILGVIAVPISGAIIAYLRNSDTTSARMALSHDAQISAVYVARDVAGLGLRDLTSAGANGTVPFKSSIQLDAAYNQGGFVCGTSATPTAKIRLLADDWDTTTSPATRSTRIVSYYLVPAGTVSLLHRLLCAGGTTTDIVVAHNIDPSTFTVTCGSPATCDGTSVPQTVTLAFSVTLPADGPYPVTLTGQRRQQ